MTTEMPYGEFGVLAVDADGERLQCHLCGAWKRSLAHHVLRAHQMSAEDYRAYAGLNRQTRLFAPALREEVRARTADLIARLRAEGKLRRWDEDPDKLAAAKAAAVETLRDGLSAEARRNQSERWDAAARQERAELTRQRNLSGELRAPSAAISAGLKRHYAAHPESIDADRLRRQAAALKGSKLPVRTFTCARCGQAFESGCNRAKYCPACRPVVAKEYNTQWARAKRARKKAAES